MYFMLNEYFRMIFSVFPLPSIYHIFFKNQFKEFSKSFTGEALLQQNIQCGYVKTNYHSFDSILYSAIFYFFLVVS